MRKERLENVVQIVKKMSTILLLDELSDFIIQKVSELTGAEKVSIMLRDENKKELYIRKAKGLDENVAKQTKLKLGEKIAGWAAQNGKPLIELELYEKLMLDEFFNVRDNTLLY